MTSADAKAFARVQHAGQSDRVGAPYIEHLGRVAAAAEMRARHAQQAGLDLDPEAVAQAAWLHDVIEDTGTTADDLRRLGYAEPVVAMVELLTKPPGHQTYEERIATIIDSGNLGAILIKLSDNEDNNDPVRGLPAGAERLTAQYTASMVRLHRAAAALGYAGP